MNINIINENSNNIIKNNYDIEIKNIEIKIKTLNNDINIKEDDIKNIINEKDTIIKNINDKIKLQSEEIVKLNNTINNLQIENSNYKKAINELTFNLNQLTNNEFEFSGTENDPKGISLQFEQIPLNDFNKIFNIENQTNNIPSIISFQLKLKDKNKKNSIKELLKDILPKLKEKNSLLKFREKDEGHIILDRYTSNDGEKEIKILEVFEFFFNIKIFFCSEFSLIDLLKDKDVENISLCKLIVKNLDINFKFFINNILDIQIKRKDINDKNKEFLEKIKTFISFPIKKVKMNLNENEKSIIIYYFKKIKTYFDSIRKIFELSKSKKLEEKYKGLKEKIFEILNEIDFNNFSIYYGLVDSKLGFVFKFNIPDKNETIFDFIKGFNIIEIIQS